MAIPLLKKKVIKGRVKQFKRHQSDRRITVKLQLIWDGGRTILVQMAPSFIVQTLEDSCVDKYLSMQHELCLNITERSTFTSNQHQFQYARQRFCIINQILFTPRNS
ncbi:uncharacterized protein LOC107011616 [Solanum pennellii]|uniref:Uncharacterized protein LOC107011616 n=1 Tax=Solanum pennellii TaxID=28526 RepID=A0ABM1G6K2_SOLPN|nr:uncharacterized protein LOC107011616 [Solanum pennellii]